MRCAADFRAEARAALKGRWGLAIGIGFLAMVLGGSAGAWAGMYVFHHKTRHWYIVVGIPLILAAQLALAVYFTR